MEMGGMRMEMSKEMGMTFCTGNGRKMEIGTRIIPRKWEEIGTIRVIPRTHGTPLFYSS